MDWSNERYIRLYTRDSTTWKLLDWRGRMVLAFMMRKATRAGVIDVDGHGAVGLAALIEVPIDIVEAGIEQLTNPKIGVVHATRTAYVIPNFLEAQEAVQTGAHRSREYRARQRDEAMAGITKRDGSVTKRDGDDADRHTGLHGPTVTKRDAPVTKSDATVTKRSYPPGVPSLRSEPNRTDPEGEGPDAPARSGAAGRDPDGITARRKLGDWGLDELNRIRTRVAAKFGWNDVRPLHPMDRAREDLRERLNEYSTGGEQELRHVLRIAELEAVAKKTVEYLGGGIFGRTSWSKKLAMREADVMRSIGSNGAEPSRARIVKASDDDTPPLPPVGGRS